MNGETTDGLSLRSYWRVVTRWKWLIAAVTVLVLIAGVAYTWTRTPLYSATAQLLYVKPVDIGNPLSQSYIDTTAQQAEIESVPTVIASSKVRDSAEKLMVPANVEAGYSVSASLQPGLNNSYSDVVGIVGESPDPNAAADAANSYAAAFIAWGRDSARVQVADAITVVQSRLQAYTTTTSRQTSDYAALRQRLQDLELLEASTSGNFKIITTASPPSAPFSPNKKRGLVLALAGGLILGLGLAFILEQFDTRVHGEEQVTEALDLPVIGHVPPPSRKSREKKGVVQTLDDPSGPAAEAFRLLRSNLEFTAVDDDIHSLLISSSVQGEGKSVIACNLAVSLALAGKRIVLVDADLRSPRVHAYMGVSNARGLSTVVARRDELEDALVTVALTPSSRKDGLVVMTAQVGAADPSRAPGAPGKAAPRVTMGGAASRVNGPGDTQTLRVLTSGPLPPNPGEIVASRRFGEIVAELAADADLVLVDAPAMLPVGDTAALAPAVDGLVYVADPAKLRRPMLDQARSQLAHLPCPKLGLILISTRRSHGYYGYYSHHPDAARGASSVHI